MRCYKCNNVLSDSDYCMKCGADVSIYKVVVKASNSNYNLGLAKARVRDLSGAIIALKTSIKINKNNIKARNLLGLIYYEMGEPALALKEWVISVNIKPDRNVASVYIRKVRSNPNKLEALNQATKKYNFSLAKSKEGGDDVALIQLKKVINMNPQFIRAYLLLALLYMKKSDDDHAVKILRKVLKIDRNNILALRYMDELHNSGVASLNQKENRGFGKREKKSRMSLNGHDVIVPMNSYKEPTNGILTVVYILLGVIIGVALIWFIVVPSKLQSAQFEKNQTIIEYSNQLSSQSITITDMESQIEELTVELDNANQELELYTGDSGEIIMYENLVSAASYYVENNFEMAGTLLAQIDVTQLPTDQAKSLYSTMEENSSGNAETYYNAGVEAYDKKDYVDAITYLQTAYVFDDTTVETPYYLAMSYLGLNDTTNAQIYIDIVNTTYSTTTYATQLNQYLASLNN